MRYFCFFLILFVCACGSTPEPSTTKQTHGVKDPTNAQLIDAIAKYTVRSGAPAASGFNYGRMDLNGDGRREGLVYIHTPYGYWCDNNGCAVVVFEAHNDGFTFLSKTAPVRPPVFVSKAEKTNGWNTLITRVSGRASDAKNVALRFDGRKYPANPENLPAHDAFVGMNPNYVAILRN